MKLMQFLMGLDESYMQIRSNILSRDPLPDVKGAFAIISSEESHRSVVSGSVAGTSQRSQSTIFNSSVPNIGNYQRPPTSANSSRPNNNSRPNDNRRNTGGPTFVCEHCGFNGHTADRCFKLIGYPADFGKKIRKIIIVIIRVLKILIEGLLIITILLVLVPLLLFLMNRFQN